MLNLRCHCNVGIVFVSGVMVSFLYKEFDQKSGNDCKYMAGWGRGRGGRIKQLTPSFMGVPSWTVHQLSLFSINLGKTSTSRGNTFNLLPCSLCLRNQKLPSKVALKNMFFKNLIKHLGKLMGMSITASEENCQILKTI